MPTLGNKAIDGAVNVRSCMCACAHACMLHYSIEQDGRPDWYFWGDIACVFQEVMAALARLSTRKRAPRWMGGPGTLACLHTHACACALVWQEHIGCLRACGVSLPLHRGEVPPSPCCRRHHRCRCCRHHRRRQDARLRCVCPCNHASTGQFCCPVRIVGRHFFFAAHEAS